MQDRPNKQALLQAVAQFLASEVRPALQEDPALAFRVRIAAHVVQMVGRELASEPGALAREARHLAALTGKEPAHDRAGIEVARAALVQEIRHAPLDEARFAALLRGVRDTLADRLAVSQPRFDTRDTPGGR
jgi:hypothetical protein